MKKKWIICALAILFIISEGERNGLRNDNKGGDCNIKIHTATFSLH